ncbi:MAG TPA: CHAP domain-containing protein, partial [Rhodothermales bacterium]|nr:CHAP domain-containing protein [Rhodothermales bacterium]
AFKDTDHATVAVVTQPEPGAIFFHDSGAGLGHCGIVEHVDGDLVTTVEGNSDDGGSREGDGVVRRIRQRTYFNLGLVALRPAPGTGAPTIHG